MKSPFIVGRVFNVTKMDIKSEREIDLTAVQYMRSEPQRKATFLSYTPSTISC